MGNANEILSHKCILDLWKELKLEYEIKKNLKYCSVFFLPLRN